ncbi:AAA family ATPase [Limnospira fusiformis]|uniref:AAA family ATPase n=1 Tax=Limnospira fusiformis TaxID=54297 RepID=UPI001449E0A6|nr:AAA family ATPase [Limnospira fusiformis SAG 85.79]
MQIIKVYVGGLFGIFNHEIPVNLNDRMTIIHGPNGFGKTVILKLLNGLFNCQYSELINLPFETFKVEFDDGNSLEIDKKTGRQDQSNTIRFNFSKNSETFILDKSQINDIDEISISDLDYLIPELMRVGPQRWRYLPTEEMLSISDIVDRFPDLLRGIKCEQQPEWLQDLQRQINVRLIESQRLLNIASNYERRIAYKRLSDLSTVSVYSRELAQKMQHKFTEYGTISQSLDRTFPLRVVQQQPSTYLTDEQLYDKLDHLDKMRSRLMEVGLLNQDESSEVDIHPPSIDETTKNILSVYVEDMDKKLSVFDDIADKIDLFRKIINKKFAYSYKNIGFSKDQGFIFTSSYKSSLSEYKQVLNHELCPTDLSSGEQHELILIYELLFKVKPDSLVLIDEPELSLHVGWQVEFIKDLQEITKLAKLNIVMATHSPDIIQDRWDLTVELQGPK